MIPQAPCKDCPDRSLSCRKDCEGWAEYQQKNAEFKEAWKKAKRDGTAYWSVRNKGKEERSVPIKYVH